MSSGDITTIVPLSDGITLPKGWSADGKEVFLDRAHWGGSKPASSQIVARNLETGRERELYRDDNTSFGPLALALSGDRRQLVFASGWPKAKRLMLMPAEGGEPRELLSVQEGDILSNLVAWMPDGRHVLFGKEVGGKSELWRISVATRATEKLGLSQSRSVSNVPRSAQ